MAVFASRPGEFLRHHYREKNFDYYTYYNKREMNGPSPIDVGNLLNSLTGVLPMVQSPVRSESERRKEKNFYMMRAQNRLRNEMQGNHVPDTTVCSAHNSDSAYSRAEKQVRKEAQERNSRITENADFINSLLADSTKRSTMKPKPKPRVLQAKDNRTASDISEAGKRELERLIAQNRQERAIKAERAFPQKRKRASWSTGRSNAVIKPYTSLAKKMGISMPKPITPGFLNKRHRLNDNMKTSSSSLASYKTNNLPQPTATIRTSKLRQDNPVRYAPLHAKSSKRMDDVLSAALDGTQMKNIRTSKIESKPKIRSSSSSSSLFNNNKQNSISKYFTDKKTQNKTNTSISSSSNRISSRSSMSTQKSAPKQADPFAEAMARRKMKILEAQQQQKSGSSKDKPISLIHSEPEPKRVEFTGLSRKSTLPDPDIYANWDKDDDDDEEEYTPSLLVEFDKTMQKFNFKFRYKAAKKIYDVLREKLCSQGVDITGRDQDERVRRKVRHIEWHIYQDSSLNNVYITQLSQELSMIRKSIVNI